ncbi:hypothetical protein M406DRAFT_327197 [Cryphonectria parasitica EP155]|uniref:Apple domain-containing protein n=1 Tax=Cryphonectria parasitica (strain ATCC 38755 / EP155) TaxID=660469 RepID=A0A9P4Y8K9_CRYP1|nr:uncharacterized protein M406DRAFT_327197 [Cryphonectria parasitica EP155]KAF3768778.1 hypothetical protein M406DRAFT_327197 [Cryphonectria parasitica EP155]
MVFNVVSGTVNTFSFARFGTISSIVSTSPQVSFVNVTFDNSGIEVDPPAGYIGPVMVTLVVMPTEGGDSSTILAQLNIVAPSSSSSSLTSSSPSASPTVPSCGFTGYDTGTNIGYYADASLATYFGCSSLCNANAACLSFAINPSAPACILYEHDLSVDLYSASSPNTFYLRGGFCPPATTTTTTSYSPTPTGKFPYCPAGLSPYNVTQVTAGTQQPYTPCIAGKSASACMHDIDGNNYCNDCISCLNGWACASDADCPAGYACIVGSDCPGNGTTGVAMCLYMLYNPAYNCYAAA